MTRLAYCSECGRQVLSAFTFMTNVCDKCASIADRSRSNLGKDEVPVVIGKTRFNAKKHLVDTPEKLENYIIERIVKFNLPFNQNEFTDEQLEKIKLSREGYLQSNHYTKSQTDSPPVDPGECPIFEE